MVGIEKKEMSSTERDNVKLQKIIFERGKRDWYVNGQKQTMVVIPGADTNWMGARKNDSEDIGSEPLLHMKIKKRFAIASNLVTVGEFRRFYAEFSEKYSEKNL